MSVKKKSVADHARDSCEAASSRDSSLLPYGDTGGLLEHESPGAACSVSCYTQSMLKVSRGWSFPDGTVCRVPGRPEESRSFCIQVRQSASREPINIEHCNGRESVRSLAALQT